MNNFINKKVESDLNLTVVITKYGKKFHREHCETILRSKDKDSIPITEAIKKRLTNCKKCLANFKIEKIRNQENPRLCDNKITAIRSKDNPISVHDQSKEFTFKPVGIENKIFEKKQEEEIVDENLDKREIADSDDEEIDFVKAMNLRKMNIIEENKEDPLSKEILINSGPFLDLGEYEELSLDYVSTEGKCDFMDYNSVSQTCSGISTGEGKENSWFKMEQKGKYYFSIKSLSKEIAEKNYKRIRVGFSMCIVSISMKNPEDFYPARIDSYLFEENLNQDSMIYLLLDVEKRRVFLNLNLESKGNPQVFATDYSLDEYRVCPYISLF